jgi:hypothetical protein
MKNDNAAQIQRRFQARTIIEKFVPDATETKPKAPPARAYLDLQVQQTVSILLKHGYTFEQIRVMTHREKIIIFEAYQKDAHAPIATEVAHPFAK